MSVCPVPNCGGEAPPRNIFCPNCYFRIPPAYTRMVNRMAFECERAGDDTKEHLTKQLHGYVQVAVRSIEHPKAGEAHG